MPKGYKLPTTLRKEEARAKLQEIVLSRLEPIVEAGVDAAMGIRHFMLRDPETGQFKRLTDPTEIDAALAHPGATEGSSYWIYTRDPDTNARKDILDRAIGKPTEEMKVEHSGTMGIVQELQDRKGKLGS